MVQGIRGAGYTRPEGVREAGRCHPAEDDDDDTELGVSVVICAYTEERWEQTRAALESVFNQHPRPTQVLLVVDHNTDLAARARREFSRAIVLESDGAPGLSGARNTGLRAATQPVTAFLDDDAEARPGWLASLVEPYSRSDVVATGGSVQPRWPGLRPPWLPPAFDWVVGCSYLGLPDSVGPCAQPDRCQHEPADSYGTRGRRLQCFSRTEGRQSATLRRDRVGYPTHCKPTEIDRPIRARRRRRSPRRERAPQIQLLHAPLLA